jgi:hypothetical protein
VSQITQQQWHEEVERALASAGIPWRLSIAWVEPSNDLCYVSARHTDGTERTLRLSCSEFPTAAERRDEILRQLQP